MDISPKEPVKNNKKKMKPPPSCIHTMIIIENLKCRDEHLLKQNKAFVGRSFRSQKLLSLAYQLYDGHAESSVTNLHIINAI